MNYVFEQQSRDLPTKILLGIAFQTILKYGSYRYFRISKDEELPHMFWERFVIKNTQQIKDEVVSLLQLLQILQYQIERSGAILFNDRSEPRTRKLQQCSVL